jgi:ApbE superfamily uncharacterized protein (UPF0280 family)
MYEERFYRNFTPTGTVAFRAALGQSDLFIRADRDLTPRALAALATVRGQLDAYVVEHPLFLRSLSPLAPDPLAPPVARRMIEASRLADVGPMAAVAGAVAVEVGERLAAHTKQLIIENGGDLYLRRVTDVTVGVYAGRSPLSGKLGLRLKAADSPCGLCTSSGTVGPSYSAGRAAAVVVFAKDPALADAAATSVGNLVKTAADIGSALERAQQIAGVLGACVIVNDKLGAWGQLELAPVA